MGDSLIDITQSEEHLKKWRNEEKGIDLQRLMGHHYAYQHIYIMWTPERRNSGRKAIWRNNGWKKKSQIWWTASVGKFS